MKRFFHKFATITSNITGSAWAFTAALTLIIVWGLTGPIFGFSDTWQLVINTTTTIITFLMVFLIQNTQNRDTKVIQIKLDELIRAVEGARDNLIDLEDGSDQELEDLQKQFQRLQLKVAPKHAKPTPGKAGEDNNSTSGEKPRSEPTLKN